MSDEAQRIIERYERRAHKGVDGRYSRFNADMLAAMQERQRSLVRMLKRQGIASLESLDILEVGCGSGPNLQELLFLGASPDRLVGIDLMPDRLDVARKRLPSTVRLIEGDATRVDLPKGSFDIAYQAVVFSSIFDRAMQERLAQKMWEWVRPGGVVLWYELIYDNPSNPDIHGVKVRRVRELFPQGSSLRIERVTLAPPIARRVARVHPSLYGLFNAVPMLRTHVLCVIGKS